MYAKTDSIKQFTRQRVEACTLCRRVKSLACRLQKVEASFRVETMLSGFTRPFVIPNNAQNPIDVIGNVMLGPNRRRGWLDSLGSDNSI
jgi:hypothetical protein